MHPDPDLHRALLAASRITTTEAVRGYEMAQDGCLPASGFARFFEMMRWELGRRGVIADDAMPKRGVVRAQTHVYGAPLRFPDTWTGRTHLVHVGGSSLHYGHDITSARGHVVVRARTVIVLLDAQGRPATVPPYLRAYADTALETPAPLTAEAVDWTGTAQHQVVVRQSDQDSFRHVNQARYIDFVDDARRAVGLPDIRSLSVSYEREALAGDTLQVELREVAEARHAFRMVRESDGVVVNQGVIAT
ncbi:MAG: thioesterase [Polyangiales bacterium]|nr:hypothetical protein [Myxococcales bacterium]MCB9661043.1 hypothetical protein [Sandaracinaceae bacterium]